MIDLFEQHRAHLRGVAYRMLGSLSEADDAVQEAWLRLARSDTTTVTNLGGWLTTVVARVCLDMLRSRTARREDSIEVRKPAEAAGSTAEHERMLADSIGLALLVVLDKLEPAERLAFVLHDLFAIPFDEIAAIVGRSPDATRQLASRARRRVQGAPPPESELAEQRTTVEAFIRALRAGDVEAIVAVLDPDVEVHAVDPAGKPHEIHGALNWAQGAVQFAKAMQHAAVAIVDGRAGIVLVPNGKLARVLRLEFTAGKISRANVIADPAKLAALEITAFV